MASTAKLPGAQARNARDKAEETTRTARALIDADRQATLKKTERLREARVAKEEADAVADAAAAAAKPAPKKRKKAEPKPKTKVGDAA